MKNLCHILLVIILCIGCVEEIAVDTQLQTEINIEDILIVEATITDELITQKIVLSRGSSFANDSTIVYEKNADVSVVDDSGTTFSFESNANGQYLSSEPFAAQNDSKYKLLITTYDGKKFESEVVKNAGISIIDSVYSERIFSNDGVDGLAVFVDSSNPTGTKGYYKYEYDETYKIIAPNWDPFEFMILEEDNFTVLARTQEERTCYNTINSNEIIQSTNPTDVLKKYQVRFLGSDNFIISHRYSILVKQQLQSITAFEFYRKLDSFSSNDNLFSQIQPGFLEGNIKAVNTDTKVIGFFDVVSITEKRLFFNYTDFFCDDPLPPYPTSCRIYSPTQTDGILSGIVEFVGFNENPNPFELPYFVTPKPCGDCTALGSNTVPDFWEE